jgi:hypothetical protein
MSEHEHMHVGEPKALNWSMIGVIIALCLQAGALIFWGGGLSARVSALEQIVAPLSDGTLARLDERTEAMKEQLDRIERGPAG